tara:strand:- start:281 stop:1072 length:792 start_codon:yes stop_codon:yes gene_type:complete
MNKTELQMVEILKKGKDKYGYVSVKAEFEAEGTRVDELLRLIDISQKADLKLTVKIGGCEAKRDLMESKQFGVDYIVAPMVETDYALSKYILAKNSVYSEFEQNHTDFLVNLETKTGFENREKIAKLAQDNISGLVFGRVDFSESLGVGREGIHSEEVTSKVLEVASICHEKKLDLVVGGAVSSDSIDVLKQINEVHLTRFETRKIVFSSEIINEPTLKDGLVNAVHFELLWLKNKKSYYSIIEKEDDARIKMLNDRWNILNE